MKQLCYQTNALWPVGKNKMNDDVTNGSLLYVKYNNRYMKHILAINVICHTFSALEYQ